MGVRPARRPAIRGSAVTARRQHEHPEQSGGWTRELPREQRGERRRALGDRKYACGAVSSPAQRRRQEVIASVIPKLRRWQSGSSFRRGRSSQRRYRHRRARMTEATSVVSSSSTSGTGMVSVMPVGVRWQAHCTCGELAAGPHLLKGVAVNDAHEHAYRTGCAVGWPLVVARGSRTTGSVRGWQGRPSMNDCHSVE